MRRVSAGVGGCLALEFANTAGDHLAASPFERLSSWPNFATWCVEQLITDKPTAAVMARFECDLAPVIGLRETVFEIGLASARQQRPRAKALQLLLAAAGGPSPGVRIGATGTRWRCGAENEAQPVRSLLAREALALFCSPSAAQIRVCAGDLCGWLFVDESRGLPRLWCSMGDCGNRAKARRHQARTVTKQPFSDRTAVRTK
ncbi:MAG: CGNR zinc finger domain-containing protein [Pseudomonadota bacterium]|nr:CGNR zinc finger domain-containing protein [Pseudomonadota bacterium]